MRSCLSAIIPSLAAALLLTAPAFAAPAQPAKEAAVPAQTAATSSYSGNAKTRIFHVSGCRYFNCKACTVRSNPRKRPAATDTNPANAVWPARADRLWKLAGVLGRSPDKGRPRFSSSPNLPARPLPAKPFMRIALFAAFSGAACLWIRHFKADPKRPPLAVPLSG